MQYPKSPQMRSMSGQYPDEEPAGSFSDGTHLSRSEILLRGTRPRNKLESFSGEHANLSGADLLASFFRLPKHLAAMVKPLMYQKLSLDVSASTVNHAVDGRPSNFLFARGTKPICHLFARKQSGFWRGLRMAQIGEDSLGLFRHLSIHVIWDVKDEDCPVSSLAQILLTRLAKLLRNLKFLRRLSLSIEYQIFGTIFQSSALLRSHSR
ncbi:hypothetical protein DFH27DRAFT_388469 [Peziza echinospora]|nr:hypothetical protein DFH27DRAFT_388469 [Peziza echinospora]